MPKALKYGLIILLIMIFLFLIGYIFKDAVGAFFEEHFLSSVTDGFGYNPEAGPFDAH